MARPPYRLILSLLCCILLAAGARAAPPQEVRTGVYLMNLYDLNMDEHSFYADFYIWFKWRGRIDPTDIEFVNSIEKWSIDRSTSGDSTAITMKDGTKYAIYRIEGRFFHSFMLNRFPLDRHELDIQIENPQYPVDSLVYLPDTNAAQVRRTLNLVGWDTGPARLTNDVHDYGTNFGNAEENARRYSNLSFRLELSRPFSYFMLKMLLPLAIVLLISLFALFLHPAEIDSRSSLPIGGLLTAVFLQQSYGDTLPDTGYMVLMDKIYLLAYFIITLVLLQVIRAGNRLSRLNDAAVQRLIRNERRLAILYMVLFAVGVWILT
jgi:hypothetical protein